MELENVPYMDGRYSSLCSRKFDLEVIEIYGGNYYRITIDWSRSQFVPHVEGE